MDIKADLKWIHQELDTIKDPIFIEAIKSMLKYRKKASLHRISVDEYNEEINSSIAQIGNEKTFSHEEIGERIKQWEKQ